MNLFENEIWWLWCNWNFFWGTLFTNCVFWRSSQFFTYKCRYLIYTIWKLKNIFCRQFHAYHCWFGRMNLFENEIWWLWCNIHFFWGIYFTNSVFWWSYQFFTYKCTYLIYTIWKLKNICCMQFHAYYYWVCRMNLFENETWWLWCNLNFFGRHFSQMFYFGAVVNFLHTNASISPRTSRNWKIYSVDSFVHISVDLAEVIFTETKSYVCGRF